MGFGDFSRLFSTFGGFCLLASLGCWFGVLLLFFRSDLGQLAEEFLCIRLSRVCCPGLNLAVKEVQRLNKDIVRLIISRACESLTLLLKLRRKTVIKEFVF